VLRGYLKKGGIFFQTFGQGFLAAIVEFAPFREV
jgi:hypothetical protein